MMMKIFACSGLSLGLIFGVIGNAGASIIDNATMSPASGGWCSTCEDLDNINYMNFDGLTLSSDSTLKSIEFEISFYIGGNASTSDYRIDLRTTGGSIVTQWLFDGGDTDSITSLGSNTYTVAYDLSDFFASAGDYLIGIAADFGTHSTNDSDFTTGPAGNGQYRQYFLSDGGFLLNNLGAGDLPFRLTINETQNVAEPATLALLGLGLAGIRVARKKKHA